MERNFSRCSINIAHELIRELSEEAVLSAELAISMRKVEAIVGSFSLNNCKSIMEVAVDFGHNEDPC